MKFELHNIADSIIEKNDTIEMIAPGKTNYFIDIYSNRKEVNAPFFYNIIENDFILRCSITPYFQNVYDAGFLLAYENDNKWIKFAYEKTDLGYSSLVAVTTNNYSDDCNGERLDTDSVYMQIVRQNDNWCLHYSHDKRNWRMVRYFKFEFSSKLKIGISCQSPFGDGCKVVFNNLEILKNNYTNIRKAI